MSPIASHIYGARPKLYERLAKERSYPPPTVKRIDKVPVAEDRQPPSVAVIEAEALGKQALGNDYPKYRQAAPQKAGSLYKGPIVAQTDLFVIQKVTPINTVRHLKSDLPEIPQIGQNVRIGYSAGIGKVSQLIPTREKTRRLSLR